MFPDGSVWSMKGELIIKSGGGAALIEHLFKTYKITVTITRTYVPGYRLIRINKVDYYWHKNNTINRWDGLFITNKGIDGLRLYFSRQYSIVTIDKVEYHIYYNKTVTTSKGVFITHKGLSGLMEWIAKK